MKYERLLPATRGEMPIAGREAADIRTCDASDEKLGMVYQHFTLVPC